ncbi:TolC family outer membrane protein [Novosphingobium sp.]|uniref:TolC family outer membrane protein n=1 Tax=Novosphingobium sp. TaxID=1874826 RepID=UPI00261033D6|nr:TolC family outer membrane protein [Novosphingobium sp.]
MAPALTLRAALLAACAACAALAPALAQDMPASGAPVQGPPDTAAPGSGYGTDDPDSGRDRGDAGAEGADGTGDSAVSDADRIALRPELPEETPADVAERAANGAPVTTLTDALRLAYWTSPSLLAQRSTVKASDYRIAQARANYGPKLNYSLALTWQRDSFERFRGGSSIAQGWTTTASAILTQPLFTFGRNVSQERSSRAQFDFQRQVLRSTEQQALLDAITAYIGVLRDRASVIIAKDNLAALERQLNDNKARLAVREVTATDVQQISTRVSLGQAQVYSAQRDAASSEASFLRMVGVPPGELVPPNPLQLPVRQLEEAYAFAETHSPVILAAQAREKVSRASVAAAKADLMPRVDFQGSGNYGSQSPYNDNLRSKEWRGQFIISGPIFESGLRRARVNEAMAANDADWRLLDASLRESRASLAASWNDWQAQQAAIASYRAAEDSARKAYEGAVLQQRAGLITTLDVLDLARELLVARSNSNTAIANAYVAKARVLAAAGALEQSWLMPDSEEAAVGRAPRKPGHKGEIPVVEQTLRVIDVGAGILRAIDSAGAIGTTATRPVRDPAGARMAPPIVIVPADQLVPPASSPADRPAPAPPTP